MRQTKRVLSTFAIVAVVGAALAFKSGAMSTTTFYTTNIRCATDGIALPNATITTAGNNVWYTVIANDPACIHAFVTTATN